MVLSFPSYIHPIKHVGELIIVCLIFFLFQYASRLLLARHWPCTVQMLRCLRLQCQDAGSSLFDCKTLDVRVEARGDGVKCTVTSHASQSQGTIFFIFVSPKPDTCPSHGHGHGVGIYEQSQKFAQAYLYIYMAIKHSMSESC